jgi:RND family efflux transporter MFP subunit
MKKKIFAILLGVFFMAGCNNQPSHSTPSEAPHTHKGEEDHNHIGENLNHEETEGHVQGEEGEHIHAEEEAGESAHTHDEAEELKIYVTAYGNDFEVFAEADPLVAGERVNFLSHFTHLSDFSALEAGKVKLRLIVNGKETSQTLSHPLRKGIYSFDIEPETAGNGEIIFEIETASGTSQVVASDITVYAHEEDAHAAAEAETPEATNATVFTKEQSWKIDFASELPVREPFGEVIKTTAQVQAAQTDEMVLTSKTSGIVLLGSNTVLPGNEVSSGQNLFTISGSSFADNNSTVRFLEAQNNFEKARLDYERVQGLADEKIVSQKELLEAKNTFENAKAVFTNLNKNFSASGQNVKSPVNGFIKQLYIQNGEYVEAGQPVAVVSQNKNLLLYAEVQSKYAARLSYLETANISTANNKKMYSLEQLNGKIISWGKSANPDNYLIPVHLQIENNGDFFPGSFVKTYLKTVSEQQALTLPVSALLEEQGLYYVYVQVNPEIFEKREIQTGASDGIKTEVTAGLNADERVVTKGAVFIKLSQTTGALDPHAGHVH